MIHITKDQIILENSNLRVSSETGDYEDTDLITFYDVSKRTVNPGSFQAQYVKYGGLVYKFNDPKELGLEILKIDPNSTHAAAVYAKMSDELLAQMNGGVIEPQPVQEDVENPVVDEIPTNPEEDTPVQHNPTRVKRSTKKLTPASVGGIAPVVPNPIDDAVDTSEAESQNPTSGAGVTGTVKNLLNETSLKKSAMKKIASYAKNKAIKKFRA